MSVPLDRGTDIICDQTVARTGTTSRKDYPAPLRCIQFKAPETGKALVFLTNNVTFPAGTVCALYKTRRQWNCSASGSRSIFGPRGSSLRRNMDEVATLDRVSVDILAAIVKNRLNQEASRTRATNFSRSPCTGRCPCSTRFLAATPRPNRATTAAN